VSYYDSDALGPGVSVRIFQRPDSASAANQCGPVKDVLHLERRVAGAIITICSNDLKRDGEARRYWQQVTFTADLGRVRWLKG
jgi:hypothetical protein